MDWAIIPIIVLFLLFIRFVPIMPMSEIKMVIPAADPHGSEKH